MLDLCQNYNKTASALTPANETRLTTAGKKRLMVLSLNIKHKKLGKVASMAR